MELAIPAAIATVLVAWYSWWMSRRIERRRMLKRVARYERIRAMPGMTTQAAWLIESSWMEPEIALGVLEDYCGRRAESPAPGEVPDQAPGEEEQALRRRGR